MLAEPIEIIISQLYVKHTVMLYALNLYVDVCQLFLNKTGKKPHGGKEREVAVLTVCLVPVEVETCFLSFCFAPSSGFCLPTPVLRGPMSLLTPASAHSARAAPGRQGGGWRRPHLLSFR